MELSKEKPESLLPPLPFTYLRTDNPNNAAYREWRISPVRILGVEDKPRNDEEILKSVREEKERSEWYFTEVWRLKGLPEESIEFWIGEKQATFYNWNKETSFSEEHVKCTQRIFQEFKARFPKVLDLLRWVLIEDRQAPSLLGDSVKYPTSGQSLGEWRAFRLFPKGLELAPYRMPPIPNFEWCMAHELTHLITSEFREEWHQNFKWDFCVLYPNDWEWRETPDGKEKAPFNKKTGWMAAAHRFPLQPEECITEYARLSPDEDICETAACYLFKPDLLKEISPKKFEIVNAHAAKGNLEEITFQRIPKQAIRLPEIKPETVYYYIMEPNYEQ